ncbi:hypothetical protein EMIHUDRAFT_433137, partial [Emiliania huxleyi CCMP1516]|uniref:Uncharacterized protein n=2 Tax=Emiliania huxleyi TaxID=2903 RepID=A0A0D3I243_EMIH1
MAAEKIFAPAKARAAPFLTKVADKKASLVEKKEAILADKRLCRALEALQEAREHPTETAAALKATAISLLQYDKVAEYREYIQSDAFAEDTRQLVTESLPALAKDAAEQGLEKVRVKATALSADLQSSVELLISSLSQPSGFETPDLSATIERALSLAVKARSLLSDVTIHGTPLEEHRVVTGGSRKARRPHRSSGQPRSCDRHDRDGRGDPRNHQRDGHQRDGHQRDGHRRAGHHRRGGGPHRLKSSRDA